MVRRSLRSSSGGTPLKQVAASQKTTPVTSSRSKRAKVVVPQKKNLQVKQARGGQNKDVDEEDVDDLSALSSESEDEASGYEDEDASAGISSEDEEEEDIDEYGSSEEDSKKRKRNTNATRHRKSNAGKVTPKSAASTPASTKGNELWRPGVKTGLGPGTQVVIDKPKPRSAGKIPYQDDRIHPNTLLFLKELRENNDREWLKMHDPDYRTSWKDFTSFLESLQPKIIETDETVPELPTKDVVFRIYRDIRFSPDPTPYKAHFSAAWSRTGRKGPYACYYLHIQPGSNFVGGGMWHPEAAQLARMRRSIDRHPGRIKAALMSPGVKKEFLKVTSKREKDVVKAFVEKNSESALKTKPKGYDADHSEIELLRLRNFTMGASLSDEEVTGPRSLERIGELVEALEPFITFANQAVMPDDPESDGSGQDDDDDDNENGDAN